MKFHAAATVFLTLTGLPSQALGQHDASGVSPKREGRKMYVDGNHLGSNIGSNLVLKRNLHGDLRTYIDVYAAEYEPVGSDAEGVYYEATLAVPSGITEFLFREGGPFMEAKYAVSSNTNADDAVPSNIDDGTVIVTFKGARRTVEYCRAEMRNRAVDAWMHRLQWKMTRDTPKGSEIMIVPEDMLVTFMADGGKRMEEWKRLNAGAKIEASDGPDLSDPTVRTVTISGGRPALVGAYHLFKAIEEAVAEELDRTTPGMWHIVCMSIDPERKEFIFGEDGSIMQELVDRTGCRAQVEDRTSKNFLFDQELCITGPEDNANETKEEITRLITEDGGYRRRPES